ncbi:MAG: ribosome small subunit-dependent GTPase A [Flavobacteriales bacterium]
MTGIVIKSTGKWYEVKGEDGGMYHCQARGKIRLDERTTTNPVAAGDYVDFDLENESEGSITAIHQRKNYIIRKSVNLSKEAQIIAANLDQALLIVTLKSPQTTPGFIDRFLATADAYDVPAMIVFHKMDLYTKAEPAAVADMQRIYSAIGYECLNTALNDEPSLQLLMSGLKNKVSLISGHSGTGKSSIVNYLIPGKDLRISEISEASNKGQHTTTFAEMHELPWGGYIVDTPGIKGFGLVDMPKDELHHHFKEFFALLPQCKFHNCLHLNEPGCAVINALENGKVAESRYNSYVSMYNDEEERSVYRRN